MIARIWYWTGARLVCETILTRFPLREGDRILGIVPDNDPDSTTRVDEVLIRLASPPSDEQLSFLARGVEACLIYGTVEDCEPVAWELAQLQPAEVEKRGVS